MSKSTNAQSLSFKALNSGIFETTAGQPERRVAPYIEKTADLMNASNGMWSVEFTFQDKKDEISTLEVSCSDARDFGALKVILADRGYKLPPSKSEEENSLKKYLDGHEAKRKVAWIGKTGWFKGTAFVFCDGAFGAGHEEVKYRSLDGFATTSDFQGKFRSWQDAVNSILPNCDVFALALGAAFGSPFLEMLDIESGGFNFFGPPGTGKTTICDAAQSVWRKSGRYELETWDISDTALDEMRCENGDMVVVLDDMVRAGKSQSDRIKKISDAIFRLTTGKPRRRSKAFKVDPRFPASRTTVLSTSVKSTYEIAQLAGSHEMQGEDVRLVNVPVISTGGFGVFNRDPSGFETSSAAIEFLETTVAANYGVAGREYIRRIVEDLDESKSYMRARADGFIDDLDVPVVGWDHRFAKRFAIAYAGLRLAKHLGIVNYNEVFISRAIRACYERARSIVPNSPQALRSAVAFISRSLSAGEGVIDLSEPGRETSVKDFDACMGIRFKRPDGTICHAVKLEKLPLLSHSQLSPQQLSDELKARDLCWQVKGGKSSIPVKVPGVAGSKRRLICIKPAIFDVS